MLTGALSLGYANIALFYKKNDNLYADNLMHIGSGKKVNSPQDNIPDYFYAKKINSENRGYSHIRQELGEASILMQVASEAGETVFNALDRMRVLVKMYYDPNSDSDEQNAIKAEFDSLKGQVDFTVANAAYDGRKLIEDNGSGALDSVNIDPYDINVKYDISFTGDDVADVSTLTLGSGNKEDDSNAVQAELNKAGSYLAKVSAYSQGLRSQSNIISKKMTVNSSVEERLVETDTGAEIAKAVDRDIRSQSSLAMMAQANVMRGSIMRLFGM
ncbi:MAG: hypothetical protein GX556_11205 [Fibrobacter sp.]|nr:hypothetical protein [Fibrobacter sp.]